MVFDEQSKNVLILEDMSSALDHVVEIVTSLDYNPLTAMCRQDFLGLRKTNDYFAVILDNNAPYDRDAMASGMIKANIGLKLAMYFLRREPDVRVALHTSSKRTPAIDDYVQKGMVYMPKLASLEDIRNFLL